MTDLLERLGRAVRDEEQWGERLDAQAERALQDAQAPDAERLRAAYAPLSAEVRAAIAARIAGELAQGAGATEPSAVPPSAVGVAPVAHLRPGRSWLWAAPVLAAAAALLLWLGTGVQDQERQLASYQLEVQGDVAALRRAQPGGSGGDPLAPGASAPPAPAALHVSPGSPLVLTLRPERPASPEVQAHVYLRSEGGLQRLPARTRVAPGGAVQLELDPEGTWPAAGQLVVWIGVQGTEPAATQLATSGPASGPAWQRLERPFTRALP